MLEVFKSLSEFRASGLEDCLEDLGFRGCGSVSPKP